LVILEKRNRSTILLLADALLFQMAALFYTAATQMEKLRLNNMTTNLPDKMAMAMVGAGSSGSGDGGGQKWERVWMGRRLKSLWGNDAINPQPNRQ
jgi:hypothetical protein